MLTPSSRIRLGGCHCCCLYYAEDAEIYICWVSLVLCLMLFD